MDPSPVIYGLVVPVLLALATFILTRRLERRRAERENARKDTEQLDAAKKVDSVLRHSIASAVNSVRSQLEPHFHSVTPDRPATPEQVERVERAALDFRRLDERLHELQDEGLRRQVHMWYLNLARAADDLEHISRQPEDFSWVPNELVRKTKRSYALSRQQAARRRLQSILDDGTQLELIGSL